MTPLQRYQSDLDAGLISADSEQLRVVTRLDSLFAELIELKSGHQGFFFRFFARFTGARRHSASSPQGIYLWGGVGRGKTYLMDILCDCLPRQMRLRTHFHRFMQSVHTQLRDLQGTSNPLEQVAANIAARHQVLCFDEFFVLDIGDAMILAGLLEALFKRGVVLVATSNIDPDGLYKEGLQRMRFLPAIESIKRHTLLLPIGEGADYRLRTLRKATLFYHPSDAASETRLIASFRDLAPDLETLKEKQEIEILGRKLMTKYCADDIVWFDFKELCGGPRSAFDYVEIAKLYHGVFISDMPQLDDDSNDQARRFVHLVDELYDRRVKLILAAAVAMELLYTGSRLTFEFERTQSRLIEMQSTEYLSYQHRA